MRGRLHVLQRPPCPRAATASGRCTLPLARGSVLLALRLLSAALLPLPAQRALLRLAAAAAAAVGAVVRQLLLPIRLLLLLPLLPLLLLLLRLLPILRLGRLLPRLRRRHVCAQLAQHGLPARLLLNRAQRLLQLLISGGRPSSCARRLRRGRGGAEGQL